MFNYFYNCIHNIEFFVFFASKIPLCATPIKKNPHNSLIS